MHSMGKLLMQSPTNIGKQIGSCQPAALAESLQIIGDAHNRCCHDWDFHVCQKEWNTQSEDVKSADQYICRKPAERRPIPKTYDVKPPSFDIIKRLIFIAVRLSFDSWSRSQVAGLLLSDNILRFHHVKIMKACLRVCIHSDIRGLRSQ